MPAGAIGSGVFYGPRSLQHSLHNIDFYMGYHRIPMGQWLVGKYVAMGPSSTWNGKDWHQDIIALVFS